MGKLRNASTDIGAFAQWIGRKCRNHHPLSELGLQAREGLPSTYKAKSKGDVFIVHGNTTTPVVLYEAGGRAFAMELREVDPAEYADTPREAVGY